MKNSTGDEVADQLLSAIGVIKRRGSNDLALEATRWELIIRTHAMPAAEPLAVDFAAPAKPEASAAPTTPAPTTPTTTPTTPTTPSR